MHSTYIVDGSNVCHWDKRKNENDCSILPLLSILNAMLEHGDDFLCVFDANIRHVLRRCGRPDEAKMLTDIGKKYRSRFFFVTAQTQADRTIIAEAEELNALIITNDKFDKAEDKCEWLQDERIYRLCRGQVTPSGIVLVEKLAYGKIPVDLDAVKVAQKVSERISNLGPLKGNGHTDFRKMFSDSDDEHKRQDAELADLEARISLHKESKTWSYVKKGLIIIGGIASLLAGGIAYTKSLEARDRATMDRINKLYD